MGCTPHLKAFMPEDAGVLSEFVTRFDAIATTPHVVTEVAYFVNKLSAGRASNLRAWFVQWVHQLDEIKVTSRSATAREEFAWLDLADCTLLEAAGPEDVLLTTDAQLAYRRLDLGMPTVNFNALREQAGIL